MLLTACLFYFLSSSPVFAQTAALLASEQEIFLNQGGDQKGEERVAINSQQKSEPQSDSSTQYCISVALERGGLDKASEHLQILQQTSPHFVDTLQIKKPASVDKKLQSKPQSNS